MKHISLLLASFLFLASNLTLAQVPAQTGACGEPNAQACDSLLNLTQGSFSATPLMDGSMQDYGDTDHNIVSLYGAYGNDESNPLGPNAQKALDHYNRGVTLSGKIVPRCPNGNTTGTCTGGAPKSIVFLIIGFSNCDQEICGGLVEAWRDKRHSNGLNQLSGQPCATKCPNLHNPDFTQPWNQIPGDPLLQPSLLNQVYPDQANPNTWLVNANIVVWDGALGAQNLSKWDPTTFGYYATNDCSNGGPDAECNYKRVRNDLSYNGYTENQVQAVFIHTSDSFPNCDLKHLYCTAESGNLPDAYLSEQYLGDILRYLKCCRLNPDGTSTGQPRYPYLQEVFITSRTYGGYANGMPFGCLMPEPFAYEEGFAVQRAIVAQINSAPGVDPAPYIGAVDYTLDSNGNNIGHAPWFDWGPYLWASRDIPRSDGLVWCNQQLGTPCFGEQDVRFGDPLDQANYWGDFTHPTAAGEGKAANQLVKWISAGNLGIQSYISNWIRPWIKP